VPEATSSFHYTLRCLRFADKGWDARRKIFWKKVLDSRGNKSYIHGTHKQKEIEMMDSMLPEAIVMAVIFFILTQTGVVGW